MNTILTNPLPRRPRRTALSITAVLGLLFAATSTVLVSGWALMIAAGIAGLPLGFTESVLVAGLLRASLTGIKVNAW